jgi:hypothetical protein
MTLRISGVDFKTANYAVMNFHYSKKMPIGKLVKYGVWENEKFIGVVLFARGSSPFLGSAYNLHQTEVCELVRVALDKHIAPVSQIVAQTLKLLKENNPKLRLVVSFADLRQNHHGGIYQAMNWIYTGVSSENREFFYKGEWIHSRNAGARGFKTASGVYVKEKTGMAALTDEERKQIPVRVIPGKHRYLFPLDKAIRRKVAKLSLDYPSAVEGLEASHDNSVVEVQVQFLPTAQIK